MSRVLVVDDDPSTLDTFAAILRLAGFDVTTAATGRAALEIAHDYLPDVILADLRLPDMTGVDVLRSLKSERTSIAMILMTAFASIDSAVDAVRLGANDYLEKPVTEDVLIDVVRRAFARHNTGVAVVQAEACAAAGRGWRRSVCPHGEPRG